MKNSSENFIPRDLSWIAFNDRVLQEGLDEKVPFAERLKFLAITSSNLDEFCKVRVAGAQQQSHSENETLAQDADALLNEMSYQTHELVARQSEGIRNILANLQQFGLHIIQYQALNPKTQSYLRSYFTTDILPILTPLAVEDIAPMPLLPALQLHVALWLKIPSSIGYLKSGHSAAQSPAAQSPVADSSLNSEKKSVPKKTKKSPKNQKSKKNAAPFEEVKSSTGVLEPSSENFKSSSLDSEPSSEEFGNLYEYLENLSENSSQEERFEEKLAVIPVPSQLSRLVKFLDSPDWSDYVFLEQVIAYNADLLFPGCEVLAHAIFRITRDEDVFIHGDSANYTEVVENAVLSRKHREIVRMEISAEGDERIRKTLENLLNLKQRDVFEIRAPLDATVLFELAENPRLQEQKYEDWPPVEPTDLMDCENLYERITQRDVLLFMPYEKFTPVVELLEKAASDPNVLAIKQTLYRTSGDSPIVKALIKAAQNEKEVSVLVELRARFDESRNIRWTQQLEEAGCHVIYGIAGLKTHAKAMLIIRREKGRIMRYAHLSTGNYNDKTAKLYSDIGLMTCNPEITSDVAAFFNILTGYSEAVGWKRLTVEPVLLKRRFIELIEREITVSTPEQPGCIRAKVNALEDKNVIEALYRASQSGVKIQLNVRGICCLRPGIPGLSENIEVYSIIDRFLEHARIFYFHNGGDSELYLASSDWMTRNLENRLEILFPILSQTQKKRILGALNLYLADNQKSQVLHSDGTWTKRQVEYGREQIRAQEILHDEAVEAANSPSHPPVQYVPLRRPE